MTELYKIEKGIPMPLSKTNTRYEKMEIGDSFEFPIEKQKSIIASASAFSKRTNKKFSCRGNRIWRVK